MYIIRSREGESFKLKIVMIASRLIKQGPLEDMVHYDTEQYPTKSCALVTDTGTHHHDLKIQLLLVERACFSGARRKCPSNRSQKLALHFRKLVIGWMTLSMSAQCTC